MEKTARFGAVSELVGRRSGDSDGELSAVDQAARDGRNSEGIGAGDGVGGRGRPSASSASACGRAAGAAADCSNRRGGEHQDEEAAPATAAREGEEQKAGEGCARGCGVPGGLAGWRTRRSELWFTQFRSSGGREGLDD